MKLKLHFGLCLLSSSYLFNVIEICLYILYMYVDMIFILIYKLNLGYISGYIIYLCN